MQRHRDIAASPVRSSTEVWDTISQLITDTLTRSPHIPPQQVSVALAVAAPTCMMLTAGGYLERDPLVLVAADLQLSIATVSGDRAFSVEENLNPVPGAAEEHDWTLHLPTPEPHAQTIADAVDGVMHLSAKPAPAVGPTPTSSTDSASKGRSSVLNLQALAERQTRP
jgi:hypothetical protein